MKKYILSVFIILWVFAFPLTAQEFAYIHIENGTGTNSVDTAWTNISTGSTADFIEDTTSTYWSFASNVLIAASNASVEGMYALKYSLSFNAGVGVWYVGISIDGNTPIEPIFQRSISNTRKDAGNVSGILMINVTQGQTIEFVVRSDDPAGAEFTPSYAQLAIVPVAQNSVNYYAGMHISTQTTFPSIGTAFAKLNNAFTAIPEMNDWTFGTNDLTAGSNAGGLYYVSYSVSFTGDGAPTSPAKYTFELVKNDISGSTNIYARRSTSDSDIGNVSAGGLVNISSGDVLHLEARTETANKDLIVEKATVSLYKLDDTSPASYAGMAISSDQTVSIAASNTWTTVGNYSLSGASGWGMSSNIFTLNSTDAYGNYYIEYSTSLSTTNAAGDDIELGVFIGDKLHPEMTVKRRLLNSTAVGAVCGVGIFNADGPDSTLSLKIRNTTSSSDLTIKKSLMGFSQIQYVYSDTPLPITLNNFIVEKIDGAVNISWQTESEIENLGFRIYRNENNEPYKIIASFENNDELKGHGTSTLPVNYKYIDHQVEPGKTYTYFLADVSYQMEEKQHEDIARSIYLPYELKVGEAFPNPFNPVTTIPFELDRNSFVSIELYNAVGRKIGTIAQEYFFKGSHSARIQNHALKTGIYFVRITSENRSEIRKILLLK